MIQILGLRDNPVNPKAKMEVFFERGWRFTTADEVFTSAAGLLAKIPPAEHYNLYFTVADCFEERGRKLKEQWLIPFDIDNIGLPEDTQETMEAKAKSVAEIAISAIGLVYNKTAVVFTGNGVQFFVKISNAFCDENFFDINRDFYVALCDKIRFKFLAAGVVGNVDTTVFSKGRLMRFPMTENRKPGKQTRIARVLQPDLEAIDFDLKVASGIAELQKHEALSPHSLAKYPKPDTNGVLAGCAFIQHAFADAKTLPEFEWYAAISIVSRLDDGEKLCQTMSEPYPGYSFYETQNKVEQSLKSSGPRLCKNISTFFDGCKKCPHNGKIASPILIFSEDYIKTKDNGFRKTTLGADGIPKTSTPDYDDLIRQFKKEFYYVVMEDNGEVHIFNGVFWEPMSTAKIGEWLEKTIKRPSPAAREVHEALAKIGRYNLKSRDWFTQSAEQKMNFKNGVLNLQTYELTPHSPEHGFTYVLPYAYDPRAASPIWDKFLGDVTKENRVLATMLEEFSGYAIYGGECLAQKALICLGEGKNGKSVFAETIAAVIGEENSSTLMLHQLSNEQMRDDLVGSLLNYSDESSKFSLSGNATAELKQLITGGVTQVKRVFERPFAHRNKAKFIILANDLPNNNDTSAGFFRRFIIAKFDRMFTEADDNKLIRAQLREELPGICNKLIIAFKTLQLRNYEFIQPEESKMALAEYREASNPIMVFAKDHDIELGTLEEFIIMPELYSEKYEPWTRGNNERPISRVMFSKEMKRIFPGADVRNMRTEGGVRKCIFGIKVKAAEGEF